MANQSNQNFTVYLGDDCSHYDLKTICDKFFDKLNIYYHRFDENLGGKDIVAQWERCIALSIQEEWIWLFSDDDIAEDNCVLNFYQALAKTNNQYDIYSFNALIIDKNNKVIGVCPENPQVETSSELALGTLDEKRSNCMPVYIFRRKIYLELGGIVNFAFGQASDWATSIQFARNTGIYTINGSKLRWRYSDENISSLASRQKNKMIYGHLSFIRWINNLYREEINEEAEIFQERIKSTSLKNLQSVICWHYKGIPYSEILKVADLIHEIFDINYIDSLYFCVKCNYLVTRKNIKKGVKKRQNRVKKYLERRFLKFR